MRDRYAAAIEATETNAQFYYQIVRFVAEFKDSHFSARIPSDYRADLGYRATETGQRHTVTADLPGIGGTLTYKNSGVAGALRDVPMDQIVLETDAPFLAPVPHRGKRNEPAYVRLVAEKLAEVKGLSVEDVERITTENARALFRIS